MSWIMILIVNEAEDRPSFRSSKENLHALCTSVLDIVDQLARRGVALHASSQRLLHESIRVSEIVNCHISIASSIPLRLRCGDMRYLFYP